MDAEGEVLSATSLSLGISAVAVAIAAAPAVPCAAMLGLARPRLREPLAAAARVGMAFPTVLVGLLVYGLLSRHGPLGSLGLLFTPQAIVAGEVLLALPMILALGADAVASLDPRFLETTSSLRLSRARVAWLA